MKILYFKNIHWDKLNNILHANIWFYILIKIMVKIFYVNCVHGQTATLKKQQRVITSLGGKCAFSSMF
jgi:hypothetical protein